jgi:hypothetical protein
MAVDGRGKNKTKENKKNSIENKVNTCITTVHTSAEEVGRREEVIALWVSDLKYYTD